MCLKTLRTALVLQIPTSDNGKAVFACTVLFSETIDLMTDDHCKHSTAEFMSR